MKPGLFIGIPTYDGKLHWKTMQGLAQVSRFCGEKRLSFAIDVVPGDAFIGKARNTIAKRFLDTEFDDLIFVDADVGFDLAAFSALMTAPADASIVFGLYRVKDDKVRFPGMIHDPIIRHPESTRLIKMQNGPTGFMRIRRRVFEAMIERWPDEWFPAGEAGRLYDFFPCGRFGQAFRGEDISFCERAQECGFDLWAVQNINLDHTGAKTFEANWKLDVLEAVPQEEKAA